MTGEPVALGETVTGMDAWICGSRGMWILHADISIATSTDTGHVIGFQVLSDLAADDPSRLGGRDMPGWLMRV